MTNLFC